MAEYSKVINLKKFQPKKKILNEKELRIQLAAAYRIFNHFKWDYLIYGHLTARVPGPEKHFLINPFGLRYDEVTASNLVKIDIDGNIVEPSKHPVNPAGFIIHSESMLLEKTPTVLCIVIQLQAWPQLLLKTQ